MQHRLVFSSYQAERRWRTRDAQVAQAYGGINIDLQAAIFFYAKADIASDRVLALPKEYTAFSNESSKGLRDKMLQLDVQMRIRCGFECSCPGEHCRSLTLLGALGRVAAHQTSGFDIEIQYARERILQVVQQLSGKALEYEQMFSFHETRLSDLDRQSCVRRR